MYFRISLFLCLFVGNIAVLYAAATERSSSSSISKPPSSPPINICQLQTETGPCSAKIKRWYFNTNTTRCALFEYGGCGGNANNFQTKNECLKRCYPSELCLLPAEEGPCVAFDSRWYFNTTTKKCELFFYGECGGNGNNFYSRDECNIVCTDSAEAS